MFSGRLVCAMDAFTITTSIVSVCGGVFREETHS